MRSLGHLAAIGIAERDGDAAVGERLIVAAGLIGRAGDALIEEDLAWAMDPAVGHQHDRRAAPCLLSRPYMSGVGGNRVQRAVAGGGGDQHDLTALLGLDLIAAIRIGLERATLGERLRVASLLANPGCHAGLGDWLAGGEIDDMPGEGTATGLGDDRQPRHPYERGAHHVVGAAEVGLVAGDQPIGSGLEPRRIEGLRDREAVGSRLKIIGGREIADKRLHGWQAQDGGAVLVVQPGRMRLAGLEPREPVGLRQPQMHRGEIAVGDADRRPRRGPGSFGGNRQLFGVDRGDEIVALLAAHAGRMGLHAFDGKRPSGDEIPLPAQRFRERMAGQRCEFVIAGLRDEGFKGCGLAIDHRHLTVIDGGTGRPQDAVEVGGKKGGAIGVVGVESEQALKQLPGLQKRRVGVGRELGRVGLAKHVDRAEGGAGRLDLEGVFRIGEAPFARGREGQRIVSDHIPHRRPVGVGHGSRLDEHRPLAHREFLEGRLASERRCEPRADLPHDRRQIPRIDLGKVSEIACRGSASRPLCKPPTVHQKEVPGPVGADRLQYAAGLRWRFLDRRGQANQALRLIGGAVARVGEHPCGDGSGRLRPRLVVGRRLLDPGEQLGCRLRLAFLESLLDRLPCGGTRARRVVGHSGCRHCDGSSEGGEEDEETAYFLRSEEHRGHGDPPCGFLLEPGL